MHTMTVSRIKHKNQGFTLLEMFLVIAIIAAIGFIAARHYISVSASNKANEVVLGVNHIHAAISAYSQDQNKFPDSIETLISTGYLANSYEKLPWGQRYFLGQPSSGKYGITVYNVPSTTMCKMIYSRLKASISMQTGERINYWDDSPSGGNKAGGAGCTTVSVTYLEE